MLNWIDQRLPLRFLAFFAIVILWVLSALQLVVGQASFLWVLLLSALVIVGISDLQQDPQKARLSNHQLQCRQYPQDHNGEERQEAQRQALINPI